jgi:multiple sugar transport system substrate-binding protein
MKRKVFAVLIVAALVLGACAPAMEAPTATPTTAPVVAPTDTPATQTPATAVPAAETPTTAPAQSVSLRLSAWGNPEQTGAISKIVAAFKAKYPHIDVTEEYDPWDGYWEKKTTQIAGDQLPDVFALSVDYVCDYAGAGRLADLSDALASGAPTADLLAGLSTASLSKLNVGGKQIGFPFAGGALLLYYNKTLFDAAGLDYPNPNWTFKDVLAAAAKLSVDKDGDGELDQWGYMPMYFNGEILDSVLHRFGARWFSDDARQALSASPEAVKAMQFIQDIIYTDHVSPRPQDIEGIECPFCAGLLGMYEDGTWFMSDARAITDYDWDVTSLALGFDGQQGGGPVPGNPSFVVSAKTQHHAAATLLAAFLAGPESQMILGEAKGRMPVRPNGLQKWASTPPANIGVISDVLATRPDIVEPLCKPHVAEISDAVTRALEGEILTNNTPAAELMPRLTQEIQTLLNTP